MLICTCHRSIGFDKNLWHLLPFQSRRRCFHFITLDGHTNDPRGTSLVWLFFQDWKVTGTLHITNSLDLIYSFLEGHQQWCTDGGLCLGFFLNIHIISIPTLTPRKYFLYWQCKWMPTWRLHLCMYNASKLILNTLMQLQIYTCKTWLFANSLPQELFYWELVRASFLEEYSKKLGWNS